MDIFELLFNKTTLFIVANSIYLISYTVTSMLWLRMLAIVAAAATFPYFYFQVEPLWNALFWQFCFLAVNAFNLGLLLYHQRTPHFDLFEQVVYREKFYELDPHEVVPIFKHSRRVSVEEEHALLKDGQTNEALYLLVSGRCRIDKNGQEVASLGTGDFIGELSFISDEPVNADVVALPGAELMRWNKSDLQPLFDKHGLYKAFFYSLFSEDIAQKLRAMTNTAGDR
jgi:hypothetical protein